MRPRAECLQHAALVPRLKKDARCQQITAAIPLSGIILSRTNVLSGRNCQHNALPRVLHLITALVPIFKGPAT